MTSPAAASAAVLYRRIAKRRWLLLGAMFLALFICVLLDLSTGPSSMSFGDVLRGLVNRDALEPAHRTILWSVRLPYALMAVVVGACLGLAGAETQTALNNPLASPYTLGISWAATLGAVFAIIVGLDKLGLPATVAIPLTAFVFALAAGMLILGLAQLFGSSTETLILFGIALVFFCTALISLIQFMANAESVQQSVLWAMGSLARATWQKLAIVALCLALVVPFSVRSAWSMTLLRSGEDHARSSGLSVHRLRLASLFRACLLAAAAVSFVGTIGFIGLVGPHMARMLLGEDHRFYLPGALLCGALLLSAASVASRLLADGVIIPVGIVTALVGVPIFVALIVATRRGRL